MHTDSYPVFKVDKGYGMMPKNVRLSIALDARTAEQQSTRVSVDNVKCTGNRF